MTCPILILQPGGMRNVVASGMISGLDLKPELFKAVYTNSSAAAPIAFWLAKQQEMTFQVWLNLIKPETFNSKRWPPADIDHLIDVACCELAIEDIFRVNTDLIISVFHPKSGQTRYVKADKDNIVDLLKATVSIPLLTRRVFNNNERLVDGGVKDILPTDDLKKYPENTKFVYLLNQPLHSKIKSYGPPIAQMALPRYPKSWKGLSQRGQLYNTSMRFITDGLRKGNTYVIAPETDNTILRFDRSREKIIAGYELGFQLGKYHKESLQQFLTS